MRRALCTDLIPGEVEIVDGLINAQFAEGNDDE